MSYPPAFHVWLISLFPERWEVGRLFCRVGIHFYSPSMITANPHASIRHGYFYRFDFKCVRCGTDR